MVAPIIHQPVNIAMSAQNVDNAVIRNLTVTQERERLLRSLQPKYLRYNTWTTGFFSLSTANWTVDATPLPFIPVKECDNPITSETIIHNPTLFDIITPINVDLFELLLSTHPNQPFVTLVCKGLQEGFWPWANTLLDNFPTTHDASWSAVNGVNKINFLHSQV